MALKRDKLCIDVVGSTVAPTSAAADAGRADEAVRALARLIGRQIAREQFERMEGRAPKACQRKGRNTA
jgi:hypothetical protein